MLGRSSSIFKPAALYGVLACSHCVSDIWTLSMADKPFLSTVSCSWRRGWSKHGAQRRTCIRRGVLNDGVSIINASWIGRRRRREMVEQSLEMLYFKQEYSSLPLLSGAPSNVRFHFHELMKSASLCKFRVVKSWNNLAFFIAQAKFYGFPFGSDVVDVFGYIAYLTSQSNVVHVPGGESRVSWPQSFFNGPAE